MADTPLEYIEIQKDLIPYTFNIELNNRMYTFGINYNTIGDFFTADLKFNGELLIQGEKIVLDEILFKEISEDANLNLDEKYPSDIIIAKSVNDKINKLGWEELEENCFLYVIPRNEVFKNE